MKRILILLLVCSMLIASVAILGGCDGGKNPTPAPGPSTDDDADDGYEKDDLPAELDYGGAEIRVLYWTDKEMGDCNADPNSKDTIEKAILKRDRRVEERLNISFEWEGTEAAYNMRNDFLNKLRTAKDGGEPTRYDLVAAYSQSMGLAASQGMFLNLYGNQYLDLEKPWWPSSLTEDLTVGEKLYFASGDISALFLASMLSVYANKGLFPETDLYELVGAGEWTIDKMIELARAKSPYVDVNRDNKKSYEDKYGIIVPWSVYLDGFFYGSNMKTVKNVNGVLRVDDSYTNGKADDLTEKLKTLFHKSNDAWFLAPGDASLYSIFTRGDAAFMVGAGVTVLKNSVMQETEVDYAVLPMPKYNANQKEYKTVITNLVTLYSIFSGNNAEQATRAGAIMECLASEGYRKVTPVLYNKCLKGRYAKDPNTVKMYDLIREGVVIDLGRVYAPALGQITQNAWQLTLINNQTSWGAKSENVGAQLQVLLDDLSKSLAGIEY